MCLARYLRHFYIHSDRIMLSENLIKRITISFPLFECFIVKLTSDTAAIARFLLIGVDVRCCSVPTCAAVLLASSSSGNRWSISCSVVCVGDLIPKNPSDFGADDCMPITFCTLVAPALYNHASPYSFPKSINGIKRIR